MTYLLNVTKYRIIQFYAPQPIKKPANSIVKPALVIAKPVWLKFEDASYRQTSAWSK